MKILMMTNTFTPVVGGVEESIKAFTEEFRKNGHDVLIVAPEFKDQPKKETGVVRIPAIQKFNRSDFSVNLPIPGQLAQLMNRFKPDVVHSHHPFLVGDIALRLCGQYNIPLVFTYHTMFEDYLHYLPFHNDYIRRFVIELSTGYANLTDHVIVPSRSVYDILLSRGVETPMDIIPTGIDVKKFQKGDGKRLRRQYGIPEKAFVIGHLGRLTPEKNLNFLSEAVARFVGMNTHVHFLVVGKGPMETAVRRRFEEKGIWGNLHMTGVLTDQDVVDAYHAMDVFAFASRTETQGLVLNEAMASGVPVVVVDATGVRDVVKDKINGRVVSKPDQEEYIAALAWCYTSTTEEYQSLCDAARLSGKEYSIEACARKELAIYESLQPAHFTLSEDKHTVWSSIMYRIKTEWEMARNFVEASEAALTPNEPDKLPDIFGVQALLDTQHAKNRWLRWKRWWNPQEWSAFLLNLARSRATEVHPGLVMIQIDGFSRSQLTRALERGEMPFLKNLLDKQNYKIYPLYTGLPSSTPSVQGELFYGVKQAVPAFAFFDHHDKTVFRMYDREAAVNIEHRLEREGSGENGHSETGLLDKGSSYSNVYTGGARESHFCAVKIGWDMFWRGVNPFKLVLLWVTHFIDFVRIGCMMILETVIAVYDFFRGIAIGENVFKELKFIPTRIFICVLLRELVTLGARIDVSRGVPIVHMNFLGYDEQAHRRGPSSSFAHRALKGIDKSIGKIYREAVHSTRRNYDVWVYSDHGQEDCVSYAVIYGRTVKEAVTEIYEEIVSGEQRPRKATAAANQKLIRQDSDRAGIETQRARYLGSVLLNRILSLIGIPGKWENEDVDFLHNIVVTAIGPTGNIYLPEKFNALEEKEFVRRLVEEANIPAVMRAQGKDKVCVWTREGKFILPEQAGAVIGQDHLYFDEVTRDLMALCRHADSGDFTFIGWRPGKKPMTFPVENGAHAGPGTEETNAFALLPSDVITAPDEPVVLYTKDLREAALTALRRRASVDPVLAATPRALINDGLEASPVTFRVMTYNVHSCIGTDGKISPERIARVIGRHHPDIVALQELDLKRVRTGGMDQPHIIAKELEMMYHFHPNISLEEEHYGNAVLSRFPMTLVKAGELSRLIRKPRLEPRGVIWCRIDLGPTMVQLFNTHFGLMPEERLAQVKELCGGQWLGHQDCHGPVILCGDFNTLPSSPIYNYIQRTLKDAQKGLEFHAPRPTWFSHFPIGRIDHVFTSPEFAVTNITIPRSDLTKKASDHLPLIVDMRLSRAV